MYVIYFLCTLKYTFYVCYTSEREEVGTNDLEGTSEQKLALKLNHCIFFISLNPLCFHCALLPTPPPCLGQGIPSLNPSEKWTAWVRNKALCFQAQVSNRVSLLL